MPAETASPPAQQPTPTAGGPAPTTAPGPAPFLALPLHTQLVPPPSGWTDSPLLGVTALAVHPDYARTPFLAAGTDIGRILISKNGGADWIWSENGLPADVAITDLVFAPGELIAVTETGAAYCSRDDGGHWRLLPGLSAGVEQVAFSTAYATDGILFAVQGGALLRSVDRGDSWAIVLSPNGCPLDIALSPAFGTDGIAYAPRCDHLARSTDAGLTWSDLPSGGENLAAGLLMNVRVAPDRILAQGNTQGMPLFSTDGGTSWVRAYDPEQAPFTLGNLWSAIEVAADGSYTVAGRASLYDSQQTVWRSRDHGKTWYAIAQATRLSGIAIAGTGGIWIGTSDGVFHNAGLGWGLSHPGGSRQELVGELGQGVAVARQGVSKYTTRMRLFEKTGTLWQLAAELLTAEAPRSAFAAPNYADEPLVMLLGQDYGGSIWVIAWRPGSDNALVKIEAIPAGRGDSLDHYAVAYADDYAISGRITVRHGVSGALYISTDRGHSWTRPDPAEPGACERNPVSGFGALWFGNEAVRQQLLCPLEDEQPYQGTVQAFEHGELLRLDPITPSTYRQILVLVPNQDGGVAAWGTLPNYESAATVPAPPENFLPPDPLLLTAWSEGHCCRPGSVPVADLVGWGISAASKVDIALQAFEGGSLIWRGDRDEILVLVETDTGAYFTVHPD